VGQRAVARFDERDRPLPGQVDVLMLGVGDQSEAARLLVLVLVFPGPPLAGGVAG
jgi:hypothetical protein